jgi:hypothetical protein
MKEKRAITCGIFYCRDSSEIKVCGSLQTSSRLMVWCRAGLRGDCLSVYTDFFYEPQTLENH